MKQFVDRLKATAKALMRPNDAKPVDPSFFEGHYANGVDDVSAVYGTKASWEHRVAAAMHYASIERLILRVLARDRQSVRSILDIGSGAGHWLEFYHHLGATSLGGVELSDSAHAKTSNRYRSLVMYKAVPEYHYSCCTIVNAIGVMYHIVDDAEWEKTIRTARYNLTNNGLFIASGAFGLFDGLNVGVTSDGRVYKRLRSARRWRRVLKAAGFSHIEIVCNHEYWYGPRSMPHANVLFARP